MRGQNLYSYVGNNPINYVDPTWHNPVLIVVILIAALGLSGCSDDAEPIKVNYYTDRVYMYENRVAHVGDSGEVIEVVAFFDPLEIALE